MTRTADKLALTCIALALVFHLTSLRHGHNWGGDFSQYILHAQQLLAGKPYGDLGYVYTVENPVGPRAYPPGLPIVLVAPLSLFGLNFVALKAAIVPFFGLALYAFYKLARAFMPAWWALGGLAFLAFSPRMLKFSENVLSDVPFMGLTALTCWAAYRFFNAPPTWRNAIITAALIALACSFRTTGAILLGAFALYAILFKRTHGIQAIAATGMAAIAIQFLYYLFECGGGTYLEHLSFHPIDLYQNIQRNIQAYHRGLLRFLAPYPSRSEHTLHYLIINHTTLYAFIGLTAIGAIRNIKHRGIQYHDLFVAAYLGVILMYRWNQSIRYLFPIIPVLALHAFVGLRIAIVYVRQHVRVIKRIPRRWRPFAPACVYLPVFLAHWGYYAFVPASPGADILKDPDVSGLFATVRDHRDDISGIIFSHPRVMRLFTGARTAVCYNTNDITWDIERLRTFAAEHRISHIAIGPFNAIFRPIASQHPEHFLPMYHNDTFAIYRFVAAPDHP